ncbi:uncharacterized protein LAJ45_01152 [Morchella importuna]|uniref:uncharacterized protein n=1 Tax=Morchella importuna TaxID=1174673 RepID=UPI001E8EB68A|nr:uncharacterized protein LAJ45_01152 [Morchella importuna]KAH8154624.1 hypothetical protein LAJ45_01152 [Morchella importuna]
MQTTEPQRQTIKGPTTHFPRTYLDEIMEDGHSGYTHPDSEELERLMTAWSPATDANALLRSTSQWIVEILEWGNISNSIQVHRPLPTANIHREKLHCARALTTSTQRLVIEERILFAEICE